MYTLIILTRPWTNPETAESHSAGDAIYIPARMIADSGNTIQGSYRSPAPWESVHAGMTGLPTTQPPHPDSAEASAPWEQTAGPEIEDTPAPAKRPTKTND